MVDVIENKLSKKCYSCYFLRKDYNETPCATCLYNTNKIDLTNNYLKK